MPKDRDPILAPRPAPERPVPVDDASDEPRPWYEAVFHDGRIFKKDPSLASNTGIAKSPAAQVNGTVVYVLANTSDASVYISEEPAGLLAYDGGFVEGLLKGGLPVKAAGQMFVREGRIVRIDEGAMSVYMMARLAREGIDLLGDGPTQRPGTVVARSVRKVDTFPPPRDAREEERREMERAAREYVERTLRETGKLPKWDQLIASDPKFAEAVAREDERIRNEASRELYERWRREQRLLAQIERERLAGLAWSPGHSSFVARLRGGRRTQASLIHRSLAEGDRNWVRVYQTVYAPRGNTAYKDVEQLEDGSIRIYTGGDRVWMNMGRPRRALAWVNKYVEQARKKGKTDAKPVIRSFLIPRWLYEEITATATPEGWKIDAEHAHNVDPTAEANQYSVPHEMAELVERYAKPHSLITYARDGEELNNVLALPRQGVVLPQSVLRERLGMPTDDRLVLQSRSWGDGTRHADELNRLYNLSFFLEEQTYHPLYNTGSAWKEDYAEARRKALVELNELSKKFGIEWSQDRATRRFQRDQISKAATFSALAEIIVRNYEEAKRAANIDGHRLIDEEPSDWAKEQKYDDHFHDESKKK